MRGMMACHYAMCLPVSSENRRRSAEALQQARAAGHGQKGGRVTSRRCGGSGAWASLASVLSCRTQTLGGGGSPRRWPLGPGAGH